MLKFGGVEAIRQDYRTERGLLVIENLLRDVRFDIECLSFRAQMAHSLQQLL
jgi:hypothetical protein